VEPGTIVPLLSLLALALGLVAFSYLVAMVSARRSLRSGPGAMLRAE
jgi:hypothetical protein